MGVCTVPEMLSYTWARLAINLPRVTPLASYEVLEALTHV